MKTTKMALCLTIAILFGFSSIYAKNNSNNSPKDKIFNIGVRAGVNLPGTMNLFSADAWNNVSLVGFNVGPYLDLHIPLGGLSVQLGLLYSMKGDILLIQEGNVVEKPQQDYAHSIYVPLDVKYTFHVTRWLGLFLQVGPYIDYRIGNLQNLTFAEIGGQIVEDYHQRNFDWGIGVGGGVTFFRHLHATVNYNFGLNDIKTWNVLDAATESNIQKSVQNRTLMINLSYTF